jgi:hypothetical protein
MPYQIDVVDPALRFVTEVRKRPIYCAPASIRPPFSICTIKRTQQIGCHAEHRSDGKNWIQRSRLDILGVVRG